MRVKDILSVKGNVLYTINPQSSLVEAIKLMVERDIGSLVVIEFGEVVGILTFREVMQMLSRKNGVLDDGIVRSVMNGTPVTCTYETSIDEVRRLMLEGEHARYLPVLDSKRLMGVISLYDVAKAVMEITRFENQMLKAYIKNWPEKEIETPHTS